jgi:hypothetical protein
MVTCRGKVRRLVIGEIKMIWGNMTWPNLRRYPKTCLGATTKNHEQPKSRYTRSGKFEAVVHKTYGTFMSCFLLLSPSETFEILKRLDEVYQWHSAMTDKLKWKCIRLHSLHHMMFTFWSSDVPCEMCMNTNRSVFPSSQKTYEYFILGRNFVWQKLTRNLAVT